MYQRQPLEVEILISWVPKFWSFAGSYIQAYLLVIAAACVRKVATPDVYTANSFSKIILPGERLSITWNGPVAV